jgi:hypothetical protein
MTMHSLAHGLVGFGFGGLACNAMSLRVTEGRGARPVGCVSWLSQSTAEGVRRGVGAV